MARAVVLHREGPRVTKARLDAAATAASEAFHVSNFAELAFELLPSALLHRRH